MADKDCPGDLPREWRGKKFKEYSERQIERDAADEGSCGGRKI